MTKPARRYGGIALEDRQAERRNRLIRAAIEVSARVGREGASVALICAEAGLTARYFYESFANRDALFLAAFGRVQDELFNRITARATAALTPASMSSAVTPTTVVCRVCTTSPAVSVKVLVTVIRSRPAMRRTAVSIPGSVAVPSSRDGGGVSCT